MLNKLLKVKQANLLLLIALALSIFTSFWNPLGYPRLSYDEGTYVGRAVRVIVAHTPQEDVFYDHPYFGQLFLGGLLWSTGYPDSLHPSAKGDVVESVKNLWLLPRLFIGAIGIVDTLLIYKISERRYNNKVAFVAAILFALMPMIWFLRTILLESLLLPFFLSSILLALYVGDSVGKNVIKKNNLLTLLSGILFGLAIFTKISVFIMIPLFIFLLSRSGSNKRKLVGVWLMPVIFIPLIWPGYALALGELNYWWDGIFWQTHRQMTDINFIEISKYNTLSNAIADNFSKMPILIGLGFAGVVFAAIRRDFFLLLWIVPFLIFLFVIGFVRDFHLIPLLPAFCISSARLIDSVSKVFPYKKAQQLIPFFITFAITIILLTNIIALVSNNKNDDIFAASAVVLWYMHDNNNKDNITTVSNHVYSWIPKYVFNLGNEYLIPEMSVEESPRNEKVLMVIDGSFRAILHGNDEVGKHLVDVYREHSKSGSTVVIIPQGNITLPGPWPTTLKRDSSINLLDRDHYWKNNRNAKISQLNGDLNILVDSNKTGKIFGEAFINVGLQNITARPLVFYLDYNSSSSNPDTRYFVEIIGDFDSAEKRVRNVLTETVGNETKVLLLLPSYKSDESIKFRLGIVANSPGDHLLSIKNASVIFPGAQ